MNLDSPANRLKWAREKHGRYSTPTAAANGFGWKVSTYLGHENGDRNPSRAAAIRYARAYHVRWEWLLEGEGMPRSAAITQVVVIGEVVAGSTIILNHDSNKKLVSAPYDANVTTAAVQVGGASMRGIADEGWIIFFDHVKRPPTQNLIGKLCVVETGDGRLLVRTLQPGRKRGRYDLESPTESTLRDCEIVWAARVTWIKPR